MTIDLTRLDAFDPWGSLWFDVDETNPGAARMKDPPHAACDMGIFSGVTQKKRIILS